MVKKKVDGESKRNKFARLATARTKIVLQKIKVLGNCSNNYIYEYTEQDVKRIFEAIEKEVRRVKAMFTKPAEEGFSLE